MSHVQIKIKVGEELDSCNSLFSVLMMTMTIHYYTLSWKNQVHRNFFKEEKNAKSDHIFPILWLQVSSGSPEQQDVWFWAVYKIVDPARWLLDTKVAPFCFRHEVRLWHQFCQITWEYYMSVLVFIIVVLLRVLDLVGFHDFCESGRSAAW